MARQYSGAAAGEKPSIPIALQDPPHGLIAISPALTDDYRTVQSVGCPGKGTRRHVRSTAAIRRFEWLVASRGRASHSGAESGRTDADGRSGVGRSGSYGAKLLPRLNQRRTGRVFGWNRSG